MNEVLVVITQSLDFSQSMTGYGYICIDFQQEAWYCK